MLRRLIGPLLLAGPLEGPPFELRDCIDSSSSDILVNERVMIEIISDEVAGRTGHSRSEGSELLVITSSYW